MKRWLLTLEGFRYQPKIYAETAEKAANFFINEKVIKVEPYTDTSFMDSISEIKRKSELIAVQYVSDNRTRQWYKSVLSDGTLRIRLYKDLNDNTFYDIAEYQFMPNGRLIYPCTFTCSNPKDVCKLFLASQISCEVVSYRFYGQPKLAKPSELKGIKQSFSADYIPKKCSCPCFVAGNDLWIKHRDFFSAQHIPSDIKDNGTPLTYRAKKYFDMDLDDKEKFIYNDCWGGIVLRNEAWIVFRNIKQALIRNENDLSQTLVEMFSKTDFCKKHSIDYLDLINSDWQRFFEETARKYNTYIMKGK